MSTLLLLLIACLTLALSDAAWTSNTTLREAADERLPNRKTLRVYQVQLDDPPQTRWSHIAPDFKSKVPALKAYLEGFIPKWAIPVVQKIGKAIEPYFSEYGTEMEGLASALGMDPGLVVTMNLIYQLEGLGINCSNWNNTGPTVPHDKGCEDAEPPLAHWCTCKKHAADIDSTGAVYPRHVEGPGLCTSVVAQDLQGHIWHGRNLDWNLPNAMLDFAIDVEFKRGNRTVFYGTTIVGFVGVLNGMVPGEFSVSVDARSKGGTLAGNILQALLHKAMTPSQYLRYTLEHASSFTTGVQSLSTGHLIDPIYYIVGGTVHNEGAVISRDRNKAADTWYINATEDASSWFRLQTNYDHWNPVPTADDRRTPGMAHMNQLGRERLSVPGILSVMEAWPTFNHHTDYTGVFAAFNHTYTSYVWFRPE